MPSLVERDIYEVANQLQGYVGPDTPEPLAQFLMREGAEAAKLADEIARCHKRLEIDHYWKIGDNDDSDLERVEIPMEERTNFPDGISARDATIALLEEGAAEARAEVERLREALTAMLRRFEIYAGPNDIHAGHHDLELLKLARAALQQKEAGE